MPRLAVVVLLVLIGFVLVLVLSDTPTHDRKQPLEVHSVGWDHPADAQEFPAPTTTTTSSTVLRAHETGPIRAPGSNLHGHPCSGDLHPCWVLARETGGIGWATVSHTPNCSGRFCEGKWQYDPLTWQSLHTGFEHAYDAPEDVQDAVTARLWNHGAGCSHWGACA